MPIDRIPGHRVEAHKPTPRVIVSAETWRMLTGELAAGRTTLFGLWGDAGQVHMALLEQGEIVVVTIECRDGKFPSVGQVHPPAIRLERAIQDLYGLESLELRDRRPWLDHDRFGVKHPLGARLDASPVSTPYQFLPSEGEGLHQIAVGPVHAGIIEPGHFRFTVNGETVVRLEQRLGYVHKGIESLMAGASIEKASRLAGRTSGDSTVAYGLAFANAVEAAAEVQVPARAVFLRALMAELERLANHFGDIGAICNDASFVLMHAQTGILRERCLRAAEICFGHRLMMDRIVPGGLARDIAADGQAQLRALIAGIRKVFPQLVELYDNTASLQDRTVSTGFVQPSLVRQYGAGGYVGRASGRAFDARQNLKYPPYDQLSLDIPVLDAGDVDARANPRPSAAWTGLHRPQSCWQPRGSRSRRSVPRRRVGLGEPGRRSDRTVPPARPLVVSMAAARGCDREQYRRGFSALQQVVQLLLFGPRPLRTAQDAQAAF